MFSIYQITNLINGKIYVGRTSKEISERWKDHCSTPKSRAQYIHNAIKKYGLDSFKIDLLQTTDFEEIAPLLEEEWIRAFWSYDHNIGYNLTKSGDTRIPTEETRKKMSINRAGKSSWNKGKKLLPEQCAHLRSFEKGRIPWNKGKILSEEHRQKLSQSHKGLLVGDKNPNFGKLISSETRQKQRVAALKRGMSEQQKQILREARTRYWAAKRLQ